MAGSYRSLRRSWVVAYEDPLRLPVETIAEARAYVAPPRAGNSCLTLNAPPALARRATLGTPAAKGGSDRARTGGASAPWRFAPLRSTSSSGAVASLCREARVSSEGAAAASAAARRSGAASRKATLQARAPEEDTLADPRAEMPRAQRCHEPRNVTSPAMPRSRAVPPRRLASPRPRLPRDPARACARVLSRAADRRTRCTHPWRGRAWLPIPRFLLQTKT